ncbi:STAS-like domain-containing protein [Photobacterium galatheae]|nr:STAS-like domain-containing protein [Photobacterium galatheae]
MTLMICFNEPIEITKKFNGLSTREGGAEARKYLLNCLNTENNIIIDLGNINLSPSFADECIGRLVEAIGLDQFRARVKLVNVSVSSRTLLKLVIYQRAKLTS